MTDDRADGADEEMTEEIRREADFWVMRLLSGSFTVAEAERLNRWRAASRAHRKAFAEAKWLHDMAGKAIRFGRAESRRAFIRRALTASAATAATAAGVTGLTYAAYRPPWHLWPAVAEFSADFRTGKGEQRNLVTGAGAAIVLNTATSLNLARGGPAKIELIRGEAAITAPPDAGDVSVAVADGVVTARDAQFVVRYDAPPKVQVTCLRGTVDVACGGRTATVTPRQALSYGGGSLGLAAAVDVDVSAAWRRGQLVFRNDPLARVAAEINRYRTGRIVVATEALGRTPVLLGFRIADLDDAPATLAEALNLHVTTLPLGLTILS